MADKPLTINEFNKGIAISPLFGFEKMSNMEIESVAGGIKQGFMLDPLATTQMAYTISSANPTTNTVTATVNFVDASIHLKGVVFTGSSLPGGIVAGTTYWAIFIDASNIKLYNNYYNATQAGVTGLVDIVGTGTGTFVNTIPKEIRQFANTSDDSYAIDSDGNVWFLAGYSNEYQLIYKTTDPKGVSYYKGYLLIIANSKVYGGDKDTGEWTDMTITVGSFFGSFDDSYVLTGYDDSVYFTNGYFVGKIEQLAGQTFNPATSTTYNITLNALDLPTNETSTCLAEIGQQLLIGTASGKIYPWDRINSSFEIPFTVGEKNIWRIINRQNSLVVFAGNSGSVYASNTTSSQLITKTPEKYTGARSASVDSATIQVVDAVLGDGEIIFTVEHTGLDKNSEVWSLNDSNALTLKYTYTKAQAGNYVVYGGGISRFGSNKYYISWNCTDGTSGIDSSHNTKHRIATSSDTQKPYFISPYYIVGSANLKKTFQGIEVTLSDKLVNNNTIVLSCRENLNDSWTAIGTITNTSHPSKKSARLNFAASLEAVQIKCEYYGGTSDFNPAILSITL